MEVRKYSAGYHELDTKFRKPSLELITAYAVQNPFLLGCYNLRLDVKQGDMMGGKGPPSPQKFWNIEKIALLILEFNATPLMSNNCPIYNECHAQSA